MGERPEAAKRRIEVFRKRFGEAHLYLAYHAAFPLALTPDLLYRLRTNFQRDIHGSNLNIPWIAVADLLLSRLCSEVGYELYEMNVAVRAELLNQLKAEPKFGPLRINELSNFLVKYVRQQLDSHDRDIRDFAQAQYWTALAATSPNEAAQSIALTLSKLHPGDRAEFARLGSLIETFMEPAPEFTKLLAYTRGLEQYARGDEEAAKAELGSMVEGAQTTQVGGVHIPIPEPLRDETEQKGEQTPTSRRNFYISYHDADRAWAQWIAWQLEEDGYSVVLQAWAFQPYADYSREINAITQITERIIIVLSPEYLNAFPTMSGWIADFKQELRSASEQGIWLAVQVRECVNELEELLGPIVYFDLIDLDEPEAHKKLLSFVHRESTEAVVLSGSSSELQRSVSEQPRFPGMPTIKPTDTFEIFIAYTHKDEYLRIELEKQLSLMKREGLISNWYNHEVSEETKMAAEVEKHLNTAQIILFLVSADLIASDYWWNVEMVKAIERHEAGEACVIPIILRPVDWHDAPFGKLRVLPKGGKPVTTWQDRGEAFLDIANGIRKAVEAFPVILSSDVPNEDAQGWVSEGNALHELGRYDEALTAYEQAIWLDSRYAQAYLEKGIALRELRRYDEALAAFEQALQLDPNYAQVYLEKGIALNKLKRYEEALVAFDRFIEPLCGKCGAATLPEDKFCYNCGSPMPIYSYFQHGPEAGQEPSTAFLQRFTAKYAQAYREKGDVLSKMRRYKDALAAYERAIELDPTYINAYYGKGITLGNLKRYEEALAAYEQAIELDPTYINAYNNKGNSLFDLKRYEEALAAYERAIELDPTYANAYYGKGNSLFDLERYEEALAAFEQAIELNPTDAYAYNNKGITLRNLKRYEEALAAYERAIELDPTYINAYYVKGIALRNLKRYEEALAAYEQAIELDPTSANAYNGKGHALRDLKRYEEALAAFDQSIRLDPTSANTYDGKARTLEQLGRRKEAQQAREKARQLGYN